MRRIHRIVTYCLTGIVILYFVTASSVYLLAKHRQGNTELTYADVLLPHRWRNYHASNGITIIRKAITLVESGDFNAGLHHLRTGLARAPADRQGRLLLAQLYADNQRGDGAKQLLLNGLEYHATDPEYVRILLGYLLSVQADDEVIALHGRIQATAGRSAAIEELACLGAATACYHRGYLDQAEALLARPEQRITKERRFLGAKIQWERGYTELALHQMRALMMDFPADDEIYTQFSDWLWSRGQMDEVRRLALVFQLARPDSPRPRMDLLRHHAREGKTATLLHEAADIMRLFPGDETIHLALGDFAATTGNPALAREVQSRLPAGSLAGQSAALLHLEALIAAREYTTALTLAGELEDRNPALSSHLHNLCHGLRAIAHFGSRDPESGRIALNRFLAGTKLRAGNLLAIANRLVDVEAPEPARDLLARASAADPLNQSVLSRLIELEIEQGDIAALSAYLPRLLTMRNPPNDLLHRASATLGSDRYIFDRERTATLEAIGQHLAIRRSLALRAN